MILSHCESHGPAAHMITDYAGALGSVSYWTDGAGTVARRIVADIAAETTANRAGDCPAASNAKYLMSAAYRNTGNPEIPWSAPEGPADQRQELVAGMASLYRESAAYRAGLETEIRSSQSSPFYRAMLAAVRRAATAGEIPWDADQAAPTNRDDLYGYGLSPDALAARARVQSGYRAVATDAYTDVSVSPWIAYRFGAIVRQATAGESCPSFDHGAEIDEAGSCGTCGVFAPLTPAGIARMAAYDQD